MRTKEREKSSKREARVRSEGPRSRETVKTRGFRIDRDFVRARVHGNTPRTRVSFVARSVGYSVLGWAGFQMSNAGRNAEYIATGRHSYLNQHNSGDEWLTGFGGDAMRSIYGSYYGRISALNV